MQDGARSLLKDTAEALQKFPELQYIVIGGWCPVLRNRTRLVHPGTLDVDLLFRESYIGGAINAVITHFLEFGFVPSAKHPFQLMRVQNIRGKDFVFNIDLLHPRMQSDKATSGMFVDHLDLDVPLTNAETEFKKMKSVVLPNSEVLFLSRLFSEEKIEGKPFNLITFDGMFATKMDSCQKQKRERDAFDIYLGFLGNDINISTVKAIADDDRRIAESLYKFVEYLKVSGAEFDQNVTQFARIDGIAPSKLILQQLDA
ncbi:MAG: hypothetical protein Q7T13_13730 [Polaromonas sp.]|nr:hypothetical protein [Polaromonas sp.]MDO9258527.1 hypothetical protein [Polaromonas sp.]